MSFGGKADNLLKLAQEFPIPAFFVLAPEEALAGVFEKLEQLRATKVAVRSSALNEDGEHAAWAGQLETYLNVEKDGLLVAIEKCRASASSARALAYGNAHHIHSGDVAVIVQKMLQSRVSGVAFSRHPVTGEHTVVIEAVHGLGEQLVGGQVTPDTYVEGSDAILCGPMPILNDDERGEVQNLVKRVERFLAYPVDIEWSYEGSELYLLQARPITTV